MEEYICHSGGAPGADITWENEENKYGVKTISYSFYNHKHEGKNPKILSVEELNEGYTACRKANQTLKRNFDDIQYNYVKNLLARNWFQVKNSEAVFAIGKFIDKKLVDGGTGWAVQMGIDSHKPVYVFDQINNVWKNFNYIFDGFELFYIMNGIPPLTKNFAGIGTRDINENGINAIKEIYKKNFEE